MIRVALYYPMRLGLWQNVIRGVFQYARPAKPWVFSMAVNEDPKLLLKWKPDAIIGQIETPKAVEALNALTIPIIDTSNSYQRLNFPRVRFDDHAIGKRAGEYLLERGFENLAFVGTDDVAFEADRRIGFEQAIISAGANLVEAPTMIRSRSRPDDLGPVGRAMESWLFGVPKPLAILAAVDPLAMRLSEACRNANLRVPEDVALLGVNNDELICNLASPPLSSVQLMATQLGYEAAALLDEWLTTDRAPKGKVLEGADVFTRQSTDIYATQDKILNAALRYIRDNATLRISVADMVTALDVSRSSLERRFKTLLNRSPLDEIRRVRLGHAKRMLVESNLTMPEIAELSGFRDGKHFSTVFRQFEERTPTEFRRAYTPTV